MPRRAVSAALVGLALAGTAACNNNNSASPAAANSSQGGSASASPSGGGSSGEPADVFAKIPDIVKRVEPSVVTIFATTSEGKGLGSGVVLQADGVIVTDAHVVCAPNEASNQCDGKGVTVAFADGRRISGKVIATDQITDVGLVKVNRSKLPAAKFDRQLPQQGALAIALGSPLGFQDTVTAGIISGLHRSIPGSASSSSPGGLVDLIQTDAPISPGNSGGALVDGAGKIVGLNEAYIPPSQGAVALGFATPAETVLTVAKQLMSTGHAEHAFLGVGPTDLTPEVAQQLGTNVQSGVVVLNVENGSPAAQAHLQPGDIIVSVGGHNIGSVEDLLAVLRQHKPGDKVSLTYVRGSSRHQVQVTLSNRPSTAG